MKEVLLRRLTGAGVLLLLAFGLASLLPSPQPDIDRLQPAEPGEQRVVTYELQGGRPVGLRLDAEIDAPAGPKVREPRLAERSPMPPPQESDMGDVTVVGDAPKTETTSAADPQPQTRSAPDAPAPQTSGGWSVQVASFADPDNARKTWERLKAEKLAAHVQEVHVGNAKWFRVRVGPFAKEAQAKEAIERLKRLDFRGARLVEE